MLQSATPFPQVGSVARLIQPKFSASGRRAGVTTRIVRVQQVTRDGRYFVTAPGERKWVGARLATVAPIQCTVERGQLRRATRREITAMLGAGQ